MTATEVLFTGAYPILLYVSYIAEYDRTKNIASANMEYKPTLICLYRGSKKSNYNLHYCRRVQFRMPRLFTNHVSNLRPCTGKTTVLLIDFDYDINISIWCMNEWHILQHWNPAAWTQADNWDINRWLWDLLCAGKSRNSLGSQNWSQHSLLECQCLWWTDLLSKHRTIPHQIHIGLSMTTSHMNLHVQCKLQWFISWKMKQNR